MTLTEDTVQASATTCIKRLTNQVYHIPCFHSILDQLDQLDLLA